LSGLCAGDKVTATATDPSGNTSEFSENYPVAEDTAGCGPDLTWGDFDCNGSVAPRDGQALLNKFLSKPDLSQTEPCPDLGSSISIAAHLYVWGDGDCNGVIAPRDGQAVLNHFLNKPELSQTQPCPTMGSPVSTD